MLINKRRFNITNDKKILHKKGKNWIVCSALMLGAMGAGAVVTAPANASTVQPQAKATAVQSKTAPKSATTSDIQKQADQMHERILATNAAHTSTDASTANGRTTFSASSSAVNQSKASVNTSSSAQSSSQAQNKAVSTTSSAVGSNVGSASSQAQSSSAQSNSNSASTSQASSKNSSVSNSSASTNISPSSSTSLNKGNKQAKMRMMNTPKTKAGQQFNGILGKTSTAKATYNPDTGALLIHDGKASWYDIYEFIQSQGSQSYDPADYNNDSDESVDNINNGGFSGSIYSIAFSKVYLTGNSSDIPIDSTCHTDSGPLAGFSDISDVDLSGLDCHYSANLNDLFGSSEIENLTVGPNTHLSHGTEYSNVEGYSDNAFICKGRYLDENGRGATSEMANGKPGEYYHCETNIVVNFYNASDNPISYMANATDDMDSPTVQQIEPGSNMGYAHPLNVDISDLTLSNSDGNMGLEIPDNPDKNYKSNIWEQFMNAMNYKHTLLRPQYTYAQSSVDHWSNCESIYGLDSSQSDVNDEFPHTMNIGLESNPVHATDTVNYINASDNDKLISSYSDSGIANTSDTDMTQSRAKDNVPKGYLVTKQGQNVISSIGNDKFNGHIYNIPLYKPQAPKKAPGSDTVIYRHNGKIISHFSDNGYSDNSDSNINKNTVISNVPSGYTPNHNGSDVINHIKPSDYHFRGGKVIVDLHLPANNVINYTYDGKNVASKTFNGWSDATDTNVTQFNADRENGKWDFMPQGYQANDASEKAWKDGYAKFMADNPNEDYNNDVISIPLVKPQAPKKPVVQNGKIYVQYVDTKTGMAIKTTDMTTAKTGTAFSIHPYFDAGQLPMHYQLDNSYDNGWNTKMANYPSAYTNGTQKAVIYVNKPSIPAPKPVIKNGSILVHYIDSNSKQEVGSTTDVNKAGSAFNMNAYRGTDYASQNSINMYTGNSAYRYASENADGVTAFNAGNQDVYVYVDVPQKPVQPNKPNIPSDTPHQPVQPNVPNKPVTPPKTPKKPQTPNIPHEPVTPPVQPNPKPRKPKTPKKPSIPNVPSNKPVQPKMPRIPVKQPRKPVIPKKRVIVPKKSTPRTPKQKLPQTSEAKNSSLTAMVLAGASAMIAGLGKAFRKHE